MPMAYEWYGTGAKTPTAVVEDDRLQVVRFEPGTDLLRGSGEDAITELREVARVRLYLRGSGLMVVSPRAKGEDAALAVGTTLETLFGTADSTERLIENGLRFAKSRVIVHTTGRLYIRFARATGRAGAFQALGELQANGQILEWKARRRPDRLIFRLTARDRSAGALFKLANTLHKRPDVELCYPYLGQRGRVDGPCPREWHLRRAQFDGVNFTSGTQTQPDTISAGVEAVAAWHYVDGFRFRRWWWWLLIWLWWVWKPRVVVAVIDQGIDIDHDAFSGWGKVVHPANEVGFGPANDPRPQSISENHGTPMAGLAVARGGRGAHGVAPGAALMPIRALEAAENADDDEIDDQDASDFTEEAVASAFDHAREKDADVISCSWHWRGSALPTDLEDAIDLAVESGRGGKGCVVLFSAGNRRMGGLQSINENPTASHGGVIAVGACVPGLDMSGWPPNLHPVTVDGTALWCLFPVGMDEYLPMWLVDRSGSDGRNSAVGPAGDHYLDWTGSTSKACAGAAGVAALVLAADFELTAAEVKQIMADCCEKLPTEWGRPLDTTTDYSDLPNPDPYDATGRSDTHGYGRLNALRAVELAKGLCQNEVVIL